MSAKTSHEPAPLPSTLGDLLYADPAKPRVAEADWAGLVERIAVGDAAALRALHTRAQRLVFTLVLRISGDRATAEELTMDTFHGVWQRAGEYDAKDGTVLGWIMNQARSRAIDRLRHDQRKKRTPPTWLPPEESPETDEAMLERAQAAMQLRSCLGVLTLAERTAIETAYFRDLSYAEAAERLGEPVGTIKTRIRSGLSKLREALGTRP